MIKRIFHIGWLYEVSDAAPEREKDKVLQLQNELKDFVVCDKAKDRVSVLVARP